MKHPLASAAIALGVLAGCGDDEGAVLQLGDPPRFPVPGCDAFDPAPCDVTTEPCQARLHALAACLRGQEPGDLPVISVFSEGEYAEYLSGVLAEEEPRPDLDHYERALTLLGLAPPGALSPQAVVADKVEHVWGIYRSDTDDIALIDHGDPLDSDAVSIVLVHELIHALQDRDVDLEAFREEHGTTFDALLAARGVIEGEATVHEMRYAASALGLDPSTIDWHELFQNSVLQSEERMLEEESLYTRSPGVFPYSFGGRYMRFTWEDGGRDGSLARYEAPPPTSHVFMASIDGVADDAAATAPPAPTPPVEWSLVDEEVLGAWSLLLVLAVETGDFDEVRPLALDWRGEGAWIYAGEEVGGDAPTAVVWKIDFATEASAATVAKLLDRAPPNAAKQQGKSVVVARTDGMLSLDWALSP